MAIIKDQREEPLDRNKTVLTHKLTALAVGHLTVLGCKPIETEVPISGFIVDVAGFTYPTMTEMKKGKLLKRAIIEQPSLEHKSDYLADEYISRKRLFPMTAVVEVKTTIADFKKDIERKFMNGIADLNYIIIPKSIQDKAKKSYEEAILKTKSYYSWGEWSFVIASNNGEKILESKIPKINTIPIDQTLAIVAQIAIRRCHRTENIFMRNMLKQYRADKTKQRSR